MQWVVDAWHWLWAQYVNWDLVLRFTQVLIWPITTLIAFAVIKPGRIVTALMDGGEISAAGATFKFRQKVETAAESVDEVDAEEDDGREDEHDASEGVATSPLADADPYTTVMNGWGLVTQGLEQAAVEANAPELERIRPLATVQR